MIYKYFCKKHNNHFYKNVNPSERDNVSCDGCEAIRVLNTINHNKKIGAHKSMMIDDVPYARNGNGDILMPKYRTINRAKPKIKIV